MSSMNLERAVVLIRSCYLGKDEEGIMVFNRVEKGDSLAFDFAMYRVKLAIGNNEIKLEDLQSKPDGEEYVQ